MTKIFLVAMFLSCSCLMEVVSARGIRNDEPAAFLYHNRHPNAMECVSVCQRVYCSAHGTYLHYLGWVMAEWQMYAQARSV